MLARVFTYTKCILDLGMCQDPCFFSPVLIVVSQHCMLCHSDIRGS